MGKHQYQHRDKDPKPITDEIWQEISKNTSPLSQTRLCDHRCIHYIDLSNSTRKWNRGTNNGKCKLTGNHLYEGSSICTRERELR